MSVKELKLISELQNITINFDEQEFHFDIEAGEIVHIWLDRSQAHLLMLYLQEHLASTIDKGLDDAITDELKHKPKDIMR